MTFRTALPGAVFSVLFLLGISCAQDLESDTWAATDALGRSMPTSATTGTPRTGKFVGVFYYIWHGAHSATDIYDITQLLQQNPANPAYGPHGAFHWWGQPEAGYYRAEDPWVIRRNMNMLSNAGVDFIYFDVTNAFTYLTTVQSVCTELNAMRLRGVKTPQIAFITYSSSGQTINSLYTNFYALNLFPELWFRWQGKPLILGVDTDPVLSAVAKAFFTFRLSWAWTDAKNQPHHWQWIDNYPQDFGWDVNSTVPEQIPVAVASHPVNNIGDSYRAGVQPAYDQYKLTAFTGQGRHFAEQWSRALAVDPQVVMVTQFNEWVAQRFQYGIDDTPNFLGRTLTQGETYFVDDYNQEYNRDMEPMRGGHTDNRYYQLVDYVRRFKGARPLTLSAGPSAIALDGSASDWTSVRPIFRDARGDTLHRDWNRYDSRARYTNTTGRNDIIESRVAYDGANVYFSATTTESLSPHTGNRWMLLFIDSDRNKTTGWEGYDYAVNLTVTSATQTSLSRWNAGAWQTVQNIGYAYAGNFLEIQIPRTALGLTAPDISVYFHWADNIQILGDITEFFVNGESAPDRRFNYHFQAVNTVSIKPDLKQKSTIKSGKFEILDVLGRLLRRLTSPTLKRNGT